jgi:hypothetical protein
VEQDITYLKTPVRASSCTLIGYLEPEDRGWSVQATERAEHAADLFTATCHAAACEPQGIVLYADNGSPMKGATMLATLDRLGVLPSFSRPGVSNDNPFSEALFRTLKYCPAFPSQPFADGASASHRSPPSCSGTTTNTSTALNDAGATARARDAAILARRHAVYTAARARGGQWVARRATGRRSRPSGGIGARPDLTGRPAKSRSYDNCSDLTTSVARVAGLPSLVRQSKIFEHPSAGVSQSPAYGPMFAILDESGVRVRSRWMRTFRWGGEVARQGLMECSPA